jgi:hypothetical protein
MPQENLHRFVTRAWLHLDGCENRESAHVSSVQLCKGSEAYVVDLTERIAPQTCAAIDLSCCEWKSEPGETCHSRKGDDRSSHVPKPVPSNAKTYTRACPDAKQDCATVE